MWVELVLSSRDGQQALVFLFNNHQDILLGFLFNPLDWIFGRIWASQQRGRRRRTVGAARDALVDVQSGEEYDSARR